MKNGKEKSEQPMNGVSKRTALKGIRKNMVPYAMYKTGNDALNTPLRNTFSTMGVEATVQKYLNGAASLGLKNPNEEGYLHWLAML
jgi:hypothetical protein